MWFGLKPIEWVYLTLALVISGQQIARGGSFDPGAAATVVFLIGLLPARRGDKKDDDDEPKSPTGSVTKAAKKVLSKAS